MNDAAILLAVLAVVIVIYVEPLNREMVISPVTVKVLGYLQTVDCFLRREHLCLLTGQTAPKSSKERMKNGPYL